INAVYLISYVVSKKNLKSLYDRIQLKFVGWICYYYRQRSALRRRRFLSKPLKGFITYSHEDTAQKDELRKQLAVMEQQNELITWEDSQLIAGDKASQDDILKKVADSDLILYLASAASLASKNCKSELEEALKREIRVLPIILEHCDWLNHQISGFEVLPHKGKPISNWEDKSEGWQNVVNGVRKVVYKMQSESDVSSEISQAEILSELVCQRGNTLLLLGKIEEAIKVYSQTIDLNPQHAFAYNNRGIAYDKKFEINIALEDYNKAILLKDDFVEVYFNRGTIFGKTGESDKAIEDFDKAIQLDPQFALAYSHRGNVYEEKNNIERAIKEHSKAITLDPKEPIFYNNRGIGYGKLGKFDLAIKDFDKALELKTDYVFAYNNRGAIYRSKGEFDKSIEDCSTAILLDRNYAEPYNNRGAAYRNKGKIDLAIQDYDMAIHLKRDFFQAYYNRGLTYHETGKIDLAIENYNRAIKIKPQHAHPYNNRGNIYLLKGDLERAIADYSEAINLNSELAQPFYNRAEVWLRLEKWEKAKEDLTTAKKMGVDITAAFHDSYKNVEKYEKQYGVKLPEGITLLLTERRRTRYPKTQKTLDADGNPIESPNVVNLREQLRNAGIPLGEYIKTKPVFGINTVPTEVFVVDNATRDTLVTSQPSSADILKPFLHGKDLRRWHVDTPHQWLIFTYRGIAIDDYPAVLKYLEKHQEPLSKRKGKQEWYELPVSIDDVERFAQPKLVCPYTYNHQTFAVDAAGYYYGTTSYLIPTEETWLCGLLNSRTVEWFYSQVSDQLTGAALKVRSSYIQQIPIPDLTPTQKALIAKIVDYLIYLQQQPTINSKELAHARDRIMLGYFERIIDGLVYESYLSEDLHKGDKHFFQPLLDEQLQLPSHEEIQGDKMTVLRNIFELLYERTHPIRRNLYYLDSVKSVRIIEGKI
ncbi:tetratricopeptide repeat protein, partial [Candidatus Poribacteria bacterium]|nr:tetratricopeptide repeat protein [Candidatus Poribacteria bacterium]